MHNTNVSLNDLYADYAAGMLNRPQFEGAVFAVLRKDLCLPGLRREDHDDYVSWLYPRISKAIDNYRETGSSFEVYLGTLVRLTVKEYRARQAHFYAAESAAWSTSIPDIFARESEPRYEAYPTVEPRQPEQPATPKYSRQHLILVLKCCWYVSDDFLEKISSAMGMEPQALQTMIGRLKDLRNKREGEIQLRRERAFCQFFRCLLYENCLRSIPDDCAAGRKLKLRLARGRDRLAKMRKRLAHMHSDPSNRQIAEIMGVAKGTVDAALHNLRQHSARSARHIDKAPNRFILN